MLKPLRKSGIVFNLLEDTSLIEYMAEAGNNSGLFMDRSLSNGRINGIERKTLLIDAPLTKTADGGNNDGHVVDIDKWASSLAGMLEDVPMYMCSRGYPGRIGRIPDTMREVDVKAYEPYTVSIGPYHHNKPRVQLMEKQKQLILKYFLEQYSAFTLKDYLKEVKSLELESRSFYSEINMDSEEFARMLLLDSLFILTLFSGMPERMNPKDAGTTERFDVINEGLGTRDEYENMQMLTTEDESDDDMSIENQVSQPRWYYSLFEHDLFLLENQIPFFVLEKIYGLVYSGSKTELIDIIKVKVGSMLSSYARLDSEIVISPTEKVYHLLNLCHLFFRPTILYEPTTLQVPESSQIFRLGSAMQLYEAGVQFEAVSDSSEHSLLDIALGSSGKITMPSLHVDDNTVSLLRNLIALEQMKYPSVGLDISAYTVLLLHLIIVPEDVKLLRRKGIILHHLASDKEMMYLVNRLSVGLAFDYVEDNYSLKPMFQELKRLSEHRLPRWKASLRHRYFSNPWTGISLMAASLLLFLSALQTFYSVYFYYHPYGDS